MPQLVANGHPNRDAATALFIGDASVKTHLQHIYDKLRVRVRDRASAVAEGYRSHLLTQRLRYRSRPGVPVARHLTRRSDSAERECRWAATRSRVAHRREQ